ncbi:uncharacterized protein LOC106167058 [Lingula anatina]|uniref:Uncharacterized protein LOC106167058 n=1 Tax=Lingula anatina TaxID=7574 RepID=A0A2R2MJW9_LINAN|nr:uncharacterized protein LOC106167058 [Lingula anatina]|eukprot:XP_023930521.1 uncharacterized protein LOC106167058 [Lingula anatina]
MLGGTGGVGFSASSPLEEKLVVDPNNEDARLRFQNLVANATVKNAVTGILRRASLERHMLEGTVGSSDCGQQGNKEEQLKETNDDVTNSSESPSHTQELEEPEDNVEREEEPEELQEGQIGMAVPEPKNSGALKMYAKHAVFKLRQLPFRNIGFSTLRGVSFVKDTVVENMWNRWPHQESSFKTFRMAVTGLVLFMALLSIIFTLLPSYTTADRGREVYTSLEELLRPYMGLRHHFRPPI